MILCVAINFLQLGGGAQPTHRFVREMVGIKTCFLNVGILAAALRHKIYSNGAKRTDPDRFRGISLVTFATLMWNPVCTDSSTK